ncbi:MAG: nuclear transport factor 2 family protein [Acidobacteriota bacterium]|nr:nuclear transport factor 2 family protein [Acidobacteriota bacterium]
MGALYPARRIPWATALCLSLILLPGAVLPDRLPRATGGSPEARPGVVQEDGAPESEEAKFSGEELEVFRVNRRFYQAVSDQSLRTMGRVWLQEPWVQCVHPSWELLTGWKRIRKSWATIFRNTEHMKIRATEVSIRVNGDFAWVSCLENIETFQNANFSRSQAQGTNLFFRVKGRWHLVHHHASPITVRPGDAL